MEEKTRLVLAISGSHFLSSPRDAYRDELRLYKKVARALLFLLQEDYELLIVLGHNPQMARQLLMQEEASTKLPFQPLQSTLSTVQGLMLSLLQTEIQNELRKAEISKPVSTTQNQVLVNLDDPSFQSPSLALGPLLPEWRAKALMKDPGFQMRPNEDGLYQVLVPQPSPLSLGQFEAMEALLAAGHVVLLGSGLPLAVDERGILTPVPAMPDHDQVASLVASDLGADLLVLLSHIPNLYEHYARAEQKAIEHISKEELRQLQMDQHFPMDQVGNKVDAALQFMDNEGSLSIITNFDKLPAALANRGGTRIYSDENKVNLKNQLVLGLS